MNYQLIHIFSDFQILVILNNMMHIVLENSKSKKVKENRYESSLFNVHAALPCLVSKRDRLRLASLHRYLIRTFSIKKQENVGLVRDLNPGPLAPKARIIPLDQRATSTTPAIHVSSLLTLRKTNCFLEGCFSIFIYGY